VSAAATAYPSYEKACCPSGPKRRISAARDLTDIPLADN